jgi:hypothetical protein
LNKVLPVVSTNCRTETDVQLTEREKGLRNKSDRIADAASFTRFFFQILNQKINKTF